MSQLTLDQILAALRPRRRRSPVTARRVDVQTMPNRWTTAAGDTAETYIGRPSAGNPQRYYWRVVAPNGRIIAASGQGFTRRRSARRALARTFPPAPSS